MDGNEGVPTPEPHSEKKLRNRGDYKTIPAEDIWKIEPEITVIEAEIVYTRPVNVKK